MRPEEGRTCTHNAGSWAHCPPAQAPGSCHLDRCRCGLFCPLRSVLEVWDRCRLLKELHVPKALHGAVYNDGWFGMGGRRPPAVAATPADPLLLSFIPARPPACQCRYRCPQLHARCLFDQLSHTLPTWQHEACLPRRSGHSPPPPPPPPQPIPLPQAPPGPRTRPGLRMWQRLLPPRARPSGAPLQRAQTGRSLRAQRPRAGGGRGSGARTGGSSTLVSRYGAENGETESLG